MSLESEYVIRSVQSHASHGMELRAVPREQLTQLHFCLDYESVKARAEKKLPGSDSNRDGVPTVSGDSALRKAAHIAEHSSLVMKASKGTLMEMVSGLIDCH